MVYSKEKIEYIESQQMNIDKIYLPCPGVPMDIELEVGDQVLIDVKMPTDLCPKISLNMDLIGSVDGRMIKKNKQWLTISDVGDDKSLYKSTIYLLEGNPYHWCWFHFGAVRKKNYIPESVVEQKLLPKL